MTSPGLKRPLEHESLAQAPDLITAGTPNGGATGGDPNQDSNIKIEVSESASTYVKTIGSTNGSKRRCVENDDNLHTTNDHPISTTTSATDQSAITIRSPSKTSNSPFKDSATILSPLEDIISALIEETLKQTCVKTENSNDNASSPEPPILTARQTQTICERLVREREKRLREQYDRVLACKLAEQYDVFSKANYLNSFVESAQRIPTAATSAPTIASPSSSVVPSAASSPSLNAFAAALQIQRSAAVAAAAASPQPITTTPSTISDLNHLAASLTAVNGRPSNIPGANHHQHHLSYNSFQQQAAAAAAAAAALQHQVALHQHNHHQQTGPTQPQHLATQHRAAPTSIGQIGAPTAGNIFPSGPVLLTSNLDEQLATPEALFTLFGVFGDVIRVKILFNKKDNALIQMADAVQAQVAQGYLDKQRIFGKLIRVTRSKHQSVQMPREGNQSDTGLTKDFTNSPLHRFKIPGSRNYQNIYPPSNTLHISNIPATVDENDLHKAFKEQCRFEFTSFKFFPKDRKMALMKFQSTEHATIALIKMHNFQISEENNLRVSFSKTLI